MNVKRNMAHDSAATVRMQTVDLAYDIVLKPVSHPEVGEIRIDDSLFPIGRTEPPFCDYPAEVVADLSRRHARIFSEHGSVYIADLDSKNGTKVNGLDVQQKITKLHDDDEICFGGRLSFRVKLGKPKERTVTSARVVGVVLNPDRDDLGLHPIVITSFPFLISKADDAFARYKDEFPHQVNYLSRRHAHIFLKGGQAFVEDLGSTNGTFVGGKRLDEHAVPLNDGDTLAFGGHHFVYKASLHKEEHEVDPTVTKMSTIALAAVPATGNADKTTFVAAPDSFLDIFCVDPVQRQDDEVNDDASRQAEEPGKEGSRRKPRGKAAIFFSELAGAFGGGQGISKRALRAGGILVALLLGLVLVLSLTQSPESELKELLASGEHARASEAATRYLARDPGNTELKALGTEAMLKAHVPPWLAMLKARHFDKASAVLSGMKEAGRHNDNVQPLLNELEWMGNLERFVMGRGGPDAPVRIYADEDRIRALLRYWEDGTQRHQRAFATISAAVPAFEEAYAEALSHLRRLQSDEAVYLAAIDRMKASIAEEMGKDRPEALEPVIQEYAEKYPRLGGLDKLRQDVRLYMEIDNAVRAGNLGLIATKLEKARFSTPPFQERFRKLAAGSGFPPEEILRQYQASTRAWREGDANRSFGTLEKLNNGPWAKSVASQIQRRRSVLDQYTALQKARGSKDYDERLLTFYGALDPEEDTYFIRATEADIARNKDKAFARAQELMNRAQARWKQYQENGAIEGTQRLEAGISNQFRTQARLLAEAQQSAQQGMLISRQLKLETPAQWAKVQGEIDTEAEQQRKAVRDLRLVLDANLLKQKLALLGGRGDEH